MVIVVVYRSESRGGKEGGDKEGDGVYNPSCCGDVYYPTLNFSSQIRQEILSLHH